MSAALERTLLEIGALRAAAGYVMAVPAGARLLFELDREGPAHRHLLRVVEVQFEDGSEVYVETEEPGACPCVRRIVLSELAHLLANITEQERWSIPNRELDPAGHPHHPVPEAA